jgi:iron complex transport system substrate-binding protein
VTVSRSGTSPIVLEHAPSRVLVLTSVAVTLVDALEKSAATRPTIVTAPGVGPNQLPRDLESHPPDVVIASAGAENTALAQAAKVTPVYTIPQMSILDAEHGILGVGALLGRPLQARQMLEQIEAKRREVRHRIENLPRASVFLDTGFYITVPSQSLAGQILSEAGGRNVAGPNPGPGPFDLTRLRNENPDFYLATSDSGTSLKDLRKNPRTKDSRAVRAGHFGIVPGSYLQPGATIGNGIETVARLLHPDAFH